MWIEIAKNTWAEAKDEEEAARIRAADVIKNWIRNRTTIEFLGTWESMFNPDFKVVEFDHFRKEAGRPNEQALYSKLHRRNQLY